MKRLSKSSRRWGSKRSGVGHISDAKFASLYEEADERQPGKTFKMLSSSKLGSVNQKLQNMFICSKCGKGFQSSKALCGHMACHSVKEKALMKKKQLKISYNQSDTESGAKNSMKRSRRVKCKKFDDHVSDSINKLDGYSYSNCSFEASGVEQEQEEVAISLMMLSKDSSNWGGLNSIDDSSENNSVVMEARSVSTNKNVEMYRRYVHKAIIHTRSHQTFNENAAVDYQNFKAANSLENEGSPDSSKGKGVVEHFSNNVGDCWKIGNKHECPICFEIFRSVQALGGHRRVHLTERSSDVRKCDEVSADFKQNGTQLHNFIDLNLPAPTEDEEVQQSE